MQNLHTFKERKELDEALADKVASLLEQAISTKGRASIAVSGGSTPKGFFLALSQKSLAWEKVTITLADERWVEASSDASNTTLVKENLLINKASKAKFFELKLAGELNASAISQLNTAAEADLLPLDVLILGMGEDGHTASIFPCSEQINDALNLENKNQVIKVIPKTAPHERISFTYRSLIESHQIFLHICGQSKKDVLALANSHSDITKMPIRAFLNHSNIEAQIYWAD